MKGEIELVAEFADEESCVQGVESLEHAGIGPLRAFSPIPCEHLVRALYERKSHARHWVLWGGISGVLTGFAITIGTSLEWNLVAGGKPIISLPPFIIIAFELMILFGGTMGVLGFLFSARLPQLDPISGYSDRFSRDRFGIAVRCSEADSQRVESLLRQAGGEPVRLEAASTPAATEREGPI